MTNLQKTKFSVLREGTQFGNVASVEMTEREAEAFLRAGDIGPFDPTSKPTRVKTPARKTAAKSNGGDAARIKQLEAELKKLSSDVATAEAQALAQEARIRDIEADLQTAATDFASLQSAHDILALAIEEIRAAYPAEVASAIDAATAAAAETVSEAPQG